MLFCSDKQSVEDVTFLTVSTAVVVFVRNVSHHMGFGFGSQGLEMNQTK